MGKIKSLVLIWVMALLFISIQGKIYAEDVLKIGVMNIYPEQRNADWYQRARVMPMVDYLKSLGYKPELFSGSLFSEAPEKVSTYDFIVLVDSWWMPKKDYEGMMKYVENGGILFLVGSGGVSYVDEEGKRKFCPYPEFIGIEESGGGSGVSEEIMFTEMCPLTQGLPIEKWIKVDRMGIYLNVAEWKPAKGKVLGLCKGYYEKEFEKGKKKLCHFLLYTKYGKGATIFLAYDSKITESDIAKTIVKNVFQEKVLRWLRK